MTRLALLIIVFVALVACVGFAFAPDRDHLPSDRALLEAQAIQAVNVYASQKSWEITQVHVAGYSQAGLTATVDVGFVEGTVPADITVHFHKSPWSQVGLN